MASPGKPAGLFVCPEVTAMTCRECPYNDRPRCGKDFCIRPGPCPFTVKRDGEGVNTEAGEICAGADSRKEPARGV